jgi:hypothetical protein
VDRRTGERENVFNGEEGVSDGKLLSSFVLMCLAQRVESSNGGSGHLLQALSDLVEPDGDAPASERDRAVRATEEILKPLALALLLDYLRMRSRQTST